MPVFDDNILVFEIYFPCKTNFLNYNLLINLITVYQVILNIYHAIFSVYHTDGVMFTSGPFSLVCAQSGRKTLIVVVIVHYNMSSYRN